MIEWLHGKYLMRSSTGIVLNVNGVGYGISMTLADQCRLPQAGDSVNLWIYTLVREDTFRLYGFLEQEERKFFEILLGISGIGPKAALAILSTLRIDVIKQAVQQQQACVFETVPGIGKRLAEKLLMELKARQPKFTSTTSPWRELDLSGIKKGIEDFAQLKIPAEKPEESQVVPLLVLEDLQSALENLGFRPKDISPVLLRIHKESSSHEFQPLLRLALKYLSGFAHKDQAKVNEEQEAQGRLSAKEDLF